MSRFDHACGLCSFCSIYTFVVFCSRIYHAVSFLIVLKLMPRHKSSPNQPSNTTGTGPLTDHCQRLRDTENADCICNTIVQNRDNLRIPLRLKAPPHSIAYATGLRETDRHNLRIPLRLKAPPTTLSPHETSIAYATRLRETDETSEFLQDWNPP